VSDQNNIYVSWGRYDAEHKEMVARIDGLEHQMEERWKAERVSQSEHRTRVWQAILAVVTGLVLPLGVLGVIALLHLLTRS
jgi:hypothetical protein